MSGLPGAAVLTMVVITASGLLSAQDNATVGVFYPAASIRVPRGSSVLLSCETRYDFLRCDPLHAAWYRNGPRPVELDDPGKFFTTINETQHGGSWRRRQVVTEILAVRDQDVGSYQCQATCSGDMEMGHFIKVSLEG